MGSDRYRSRMTGKPEVIPSLKSRSATHGVAWDASGLILVHKTLGQAGLEVTDISGRSESFSAFRIHVIITRVLDKDFREAARYALSFSLLDAW